MNDVKKIVKKNSILNLITGIIMLIGGISLITTSIIMYKVSKDELEGWAALVLIIVIMISVIFGIISIPFLVFGLIMIIISIVMLCQKNYTVESLKKKRKFYIFVNVLMFIFSVIFSIVSMILLFNLISNFDSSAILMDVLCFVFTILLWVFSFKQAKGNKKIKKYILENSDNQIKE